MLSQDTTNLESLVSTSRLTRMGEPPLPVTLTSPGSERQLTLSVGACVVGSGPDANYVLHEKTVSRRHVSLHLVPEGVRVVDLNSTNGVGYRGHCLSDVVLSANARLRLGRTFIELTFDSPSCTEIDTRRRGEVLPGEVPGMWQLYAQLRRLQGSLLGVLLTGASVTAKRFVARTIHEHSPVAEGPLVTVDCNDVDRSAREGLFGHGQAFHAEKSDTPALFARACGGTLFLDAVDQLPLDVQASLLRALEARDLIPFRERAGSSFRLIAAADGDLPELVRQGKFKPELHQRLATVQLTLPDQRYLGEDSILPPATGELANADRRARTGCDRG